MRLSNQKLINLARFFSDLTPIAPYLALFLASRNLTVPEITTIFSIWAGAVIFFEIPTGILADHVHKKTILVLSKLLKLACFIVFLIWPTYAGFTLGFIMWGLAAAFDSGALQSFIYETTQEKEGFSRVYSSAMSWNFVGMVISAILAAMIARFGFNLLLVLSIASMIATIIFILLLPNKSTGSQPLLERQPSAYRATKFIANIFVTLKTPLILSPLLLGAIVGGIKGSFDELHGLLLSSTGLSLGIIGFIIASFDGMKFLGARLAARLTNKTNYQYLFVAGIGFMFITAGMFGAWIAAFAIALLMIIDACFWIQNDTAILHAAHEHHRATTLSIKNFFTEVSSLGLFALASFATKVVPLSHLYVFVGLVFPVIAFILFTASHVNIKTTTGYLD